MSSYEMLIHERKEMKLQMNALKLDRDRLYSMMTSDLEYTATGFDADGRAEG